MRISTGQMYTNYNSRIQTAQQRYLAAQNEVMTGKKNDLLINDPVGSSRVVRAKSLKSAIGQYTDNLRVAKDFMGTSDSAMSNIHDVLKRAYTLAVQGANTSTEQSSREAMAAEIRELKSRLVAEANTQGASEQFVFGGQDNGSKPFSVVGSNLVFNGDGNDVNIEVGPTEVMRANSKMDSVILDAFNALENLRVSMEGGNIANMTSTDIPSLQSSMDKVRQARGDVGARLTLVKEREVANNRRMDELAGKISDIEDVDMSEAITKMTLAQTAYQAALQTAAMGSQLSLMDYIR